MRVPSSGSSNIFSSFANDSTEDSVVRKPPQEFIRASKNRKLVSDSDEESFYISEKVIIDDDSNDGWLESRSGITQSEKIENSLIAKHERIPKKNGAARTPPMKVLRDSFSSTLNSLEDTPDSLMEGRRKMQKLDVERRLLKGNERANRLENRRFVDSKPSSQTINTGKKKKSGSLKSFNVTMSLLTDDESESEGSEVSLNDDDSQSAEDSDSDNDDEKLSKNNQKSSGSRKASVLDSDDEEGEKWSFSEHTRGDVTDRAHKILMQCKAVSSNLRGALASWSGDINKRKWDSETADVDCVNLTAIAAYKTQLSGERILQSADFKSMCPDLELKEYQLVGVNWLKLLNQYNINGVLADDMGLGKTIQTIAFLGWLKGEQERRGIRKSRPHLIVVPASTLANWQNEMTRFCPSLQFVVYHGSQAERAEIRRYLRHGNDDIDVIFSTYTIFERESGSDDRSFLCGQSFSYLVLDEAHCIKNNTSSRYYNLNKLNSRHRLLLSGTPVQNDVGELLALLSFLMPKVFSQQDCLVLLESFGWSNNSAKDEKNKANSPKIKKLRSMLAPFVLRRIKSDVLAQLGSKDIRIIKVKMTSLQARVYEDILNGYSDRREMLKLKAKLEIEEDPLMKIGKKKSKENLQIIEQLPLQPRKAAVNAAIAVAEQSAQLLSNKISPLPPSKSVSSNSVVDLCTPPRDCAATALISKEKEKLSDSAVMKELTASEAKSLFTSLRKAANHPLLLRVHYTDEKVLNEIAKVSHSTGFFGKLCDYQRVRDEIDQMSDYDIHQLCSEFPKYLSQYVLPAEVLYDSPKILELKRLLPELVSDGHRVLVFSQWTRILDLLEVLLNDMEMAFLRLDGSTPVSERQELIDLFNARAESDDGDEPRYSVNVFLLSTKAGGLGINLTSADTVVMHDVDFNPENDRQAEDRCHRIGQSKPVTVIKLITEDTVDNDIFDMAEKKQHLSKAVLGEGSTGKAADDDIGAIGRILQTALSRAK